MDKKDILQNKLLELAHKAKSLPEFPGCYLMKDSSGNILYIGKAKNLRDRVSSYFCFDIHQNIKTRLLVEKIDSFEFIITMNNVEALVLENNLIKKHRPKYNIALKDDRTFPYILIDYQHDYPTLNFFRKNNAETNSRNSKTPKNSGQEFLGPYPTGSNIGNVIRVLKKIFLLRDCSDIKFKNRSHPCLLFQMHYCSAPCVNKISKSDYQKNLDAAKRFLSGKSLDICKVQEESMLAAAEEENFEWAKIIRDNLKMLEEFLAFGRQKNVEIFETVNNSNIDIVAYCEFQNELDLSIYIVRNGLLLGHKNLHDNFFMESADECAVRLLSKYYLTQIEDLLPDKIITDWNDDISQEFISYCKIKVDRPGRKFQELIALVKKHVLEVQRLRVLRNDGVTNGLSLLQELLGLKKYPDLIECYDIAIFAGSSPTASKVVFEKNSLNKEKYRFYHLEERAEGNNDFKMLEEVFSRRLENIDKDHDKGKDSLPDVFLVDGGQLQVNVLEKILKTKNINIPVVGIIKSRNKGVNKSDERLVLPNRKDSFSLNTTSAKTRELRKILSDLRDEAHRFARKLHHHAEKKRILGSSKR